MDTAPKQKVILNKRFFYKNIEMMNYVSVSAKSKKINNPDY